MTHINGELKLPIWIRRPVWFGLDTNDFAVEDDLIWDCGDSIFSQSYPSAPAHADIPQVPSQFTHVDPEIKDGKRIWSVITN
jgi:hypothetical protein